MIYHPPPQYLTQPSIAADVRLADHVFPQSRCAGKITIQWDESQPDVDGFVHLYGDCVIHLTGSATRLLKPDRLCNVVVHEAGHLAGLGHSKSVRSIMYPWSELVDYPPCWRLYYKHDPRYRRATLVTSDPAA
jgi:hypothetical protein